MVLPIQAKPKKGLGGGNRGGFGFHGKRFEAGLDGFCKANRPILEGTFKPNITRIIDVMEKNNLVQRNADPENRRKYLIGLTPYARSIKKDLFSIKKI